jgi:hypothetical protein
MSPSTETFSQIACRKVTIGDISMLTRMAAVVSVGAPGELHLSNEE